MGGGGGGGRSSGMERGVAVLQVIYDVLAEMHFLGLVFSPLSTNIFCYCIAGQSF